MSGQNPRKRSAPGASPIAPYTQSLPSPYAMETALSDPVAKWNLGTSDSLAPVDGNNYAANNQLGSVSDSQQYTQPASMPSNSLTRRYMTHALIATNPRSNLESAMEPWSGFGDESALLQTNDGEGAMEQENIEVLEERSQKAKREAQAKRKQIPPFVQKLRSFLEDPKNEDFIRWSEKGDSFIVIDEDEFAKTLIPELFKHNNYASFVRQLNMYGFHKRVGLSDNSMRASERKNKSPSEYFNPYFRRGHPNLMWLITKAKGGSKSKKGSRSAEGEAESEEENVPEDTTTQAANSASTSLPAAESQALPKKEMSMIRDELNKIREQQKMILGAINQLQRNNNELYSQALRFQSQHDRHQNSINAILNFLANVFRKTLEDGSSQNVGDIISSIMSTQASPSSHQQGSIFDLGDLVQNATEPSAPLGGTHRRARGLLPPIPDHNEQAKPSRAPSAASTPYHPIGHMSPEMGHVTELVDGSEATPNLRQELEKNPQERMMKIINDHNATNTSNLALPDAAEIVAKAPQTLNLAQGSQLADLMSHQTPSGLNRRQVHASTGQSSRETLHQAHFSPSAPQMDMIPQSPVENSVPPSLSPIMRSPAMTPPSLQQINSNQIDLDQLHRLQNDQDAKIQEIGEMLGPLSPSGQIPGLGDGNGHLFDPPNVDLDQYFDSNAFLHDASFTGDGNDFNFSLDGGDSLGAANGVDARLVRSPQDTNNHQDNEPVGATNADADCKRRRIM
ncbi:hypothetical protein CDD82_878 [Ophiocordyceps australis]|uniref:HSF-type DNA-binding domain-containing protein n=1 Tax=Ophiocordyceps australis TaxID=1399860 RepID=A0A2C5ZQ02_9HYPO|nr:hypothetical protein CDD82_878 [Ophiocordyceps australis]